MATLLPRSWQFAASSRATLRQPLGPRVLRRPPHGSPRHASTVSSPPSRTADRLRAIAYGTGLAVTLVITYVYVTDTRSFVHRYVVPPALRWVYRDAEDAHHAGTTFMKLLYAVGLHPRERADAAKLGDLISTVFGQQLSNPIGISAGLDKDAEIPDALFALGPGIVEVGGITPVPQEGNPKPRVFRVPGLEGMVNRYGLNSKGAVEVAFRLRQRLRKYAQSLGVTEQQILNGELEVPVGSLEKGRLLAVQIAKAKGTDERNQEAVITDYVFCVNHLAPYADILVVNVSSPNTPGLRDLQAAEPLTRLLSAVVQEAGKAGRKNPPKVMVKVSPDEDEESQMQGIVEAVQSSGVDGVIVGNTTKRRQGLNPQNVPLSAGEKQALTEVGGYSGPAMFSRTLDLVSRYRKMLDSSTVSSENGSSNQKVIFATGGITNGKQALKILNAGASVAMVYTGLVYGGAGTITRIKSEMKEQP